MAAVDMNLAAVPSPKSTAAHEVPSMKIVLFCHPGFRASQSMPRFVRMLQASYQDRGHEVEIWTPQPNVFKWVRGGRFAKWGGYIDEYLLFPRWVRKALKNASSDTLFVFCDQALGPWVPLVADRPHVVHVHDLLALRSALGDVSENPTSITGRIYQRYIRRGYRKARHFISISRNTRADLHRFGGVSATTSEVVYNGLNFPYSPLKETDSRAIMSSAGLPIPASGMLLHVGGGQWYKNLNGVIALYAQYAAQVRAPLPLWCISPPPSAAVRSAIARVPEAGKVVFFSNLDSLTLHAVYSAACALLFPSLAEGFGWPIIEALACGCPVLTTDAPPMNEVGGDVADYLPLLKAKDEMNTWAANGARQLMGILARGPEERAQRAARGVAWSARFSVDIAIDAYLAVYKSVLDQGANG
jgi:glycosyltransferase involved in cell wall biosynthesis